MEPFVAGRRRRRSRRRIAGGRGRSKRSSSRSSTSVAIPIASSGNPYPHNEGYPPQQQQPYGYPPPQGTWTSSSFAIFFPLSFLGLSLVVEYLSIYLHWVRLSERPQKRRRRELLFVCLLTQVGSFVSLLLSTCLFLCVWRCCWVMGTSDAS